MFAGTGGEIVGFKIGGTTEAGLQRLGLNCPFTGPIFSARRHRSGARLRRDQLIVCIVEAEVGVTLTRDVTPHSGVPNRGELLYLIDALCPAIELADSRLADWSSAAAAAVVADLGFAGAWVQGEPCADWRGIDLIDHAVSLQVDGEVLRRGTGATVLGDPLRSLQLVLADRVARGESVRAGQWISTGSWTAPLPLPGKGRLHADFGALGSVHVELV